MCRVSDAYRLSRTGKGKDIIKRELTFGGYHLLQLLFLHCFNRGGVHDAFDQLRRHVTRVIPFTVIANPEIKDVDIFVAVAGINVKKEKGVKHHKQNDKQPDGVHQSFGLQHHNQCRQPGGIHCDKQSRVFANKADAKARAIVALFAVIKIVDGGSKQALYLGHFLPL